VSFVVWLDSILIMKKRVQIMKRIFSISPVFCRAGIASILCSLFMLCLLPMNTAFAQSTAYVRVIHASPFVGTADVFVDGQKLLSSFQFASVTDYVAIPSGVHKVQIALVGKGINASVITQDLTVQPGNAYTVAALGSNPNALSLHAFVDNNLVIPNRAKVRIYHLAPDAGNVNVSVGEEGKLGMSYPDASEYLNQDAGPCTISFSDSQFNKTLPLTTTLAANTVTSVFDVGLFNGNPQVQLVQAHATGIPGLPGTGSNPDAAGPNLGGGLPFMPFIIAGVVLAFVGSGLVVRRLRRIA
jgi:Domain of unknown function (DUF4397)